MSTISNTTMDEAFKYFSTNNEVEQPENNYWTMGARRRKYHRNANKNAFIFLSPVYFAIFGVLSFLMFKYLPFKLLFLMATGTMHFLFAFHPVSAANECRYTFVIPSLVGTLGLLTGFTYGFTIFGFHLEEYFYYMCIAGGTLTILVRLWNRRVWNKIDKILNEHCKKHKIDINNLPIPIENFQEAYDSLACLLAGVLGHTELSQDNIDSIKSHLRSRTLTGYRKAENIIKSEIGNND